MLFFQAAVIETAQTIGIAMLLLFILPELDVVKGAMLMNALCFVPGLLNIFMRDRSNSRYFIWLLLDILALSCQATAFVVWPLLDDNKPILWCIPVASVLISLGWWENFVGPVDKHSSGESKCILSFILFINLTSF